MVRGYTREDIEFERFLCEAWRAESFIKLPTNIIRNPYYQKWRCMSRASIAEFLFGFVIRAKTGNRIADMMYEDFFLGKNLLVSRFTHQGLADRLQYRDRRGINNQMIQLEKEGIFKVTPVQWHGRVIRLYEFGTWKKENNQYNETIYMYKKFDDLLSNEVLQRLKK